MAERAEPLDIVRLVADYHQALYRYAYRLTGSVPDAEDLVQQAFLVAQQKLDQVRDASCAQAWLYAVLRNCYLSGRRQRQALAAASVELDLNDVAEDVAEETFDSERLQTAINALDDEFKVVVLLFYFEYRSYRDIAEALEIPLGTVMSRLARAKARLRRALDENRSDATRGDEMRRDAAARPSAAASHNGSCDSRPKTNQPSTIRR